jgi:hypothetical protein
MAKVPAAKPSGDQLIREYLTRVTQAGQRLPKGARLAFVGRTRARIERELGPGGASDAERVLAVLEELGEPEELVRAERAKIDDAWVKRQAASRKAGAAAGAVTAPLEYRRLNSRRQPATTQPQPVIPAGEAPPDGTLDAEPAPRPTVRRRLPSLPPGPPPSLADIGAMARANLLETLVIVLIGVGGLLFPVLPPIWVLGSLLALLPSGIWDARDKFVALLGPLVVTAAISVLIALGDRVPGNFVVVYVHAFGAGAGYLLRFGCLVSAGYLAWRVYQGPRVKIPPWRRQGAVPGDR